MTVITDQAFEEMRIQVEQGNITVIGACKSLKISKPTYYRKLKQSKERRESNQIVSEYMTITIQSIIEDISLNLSDLKTWKQQAQNQKDYLEIMDREIKYHTSLMKALQTYNDNRSGEAIARESVMQELTSWVYQVISRKMDKDTADRILRILAESE